jgi:hypothetical protein
MPAPEMRPLSLGELLVQAFQLYRNHFRLFVGIAAIPQLLLLAFGLTAEVLQRGGPQGQGGVPGAAVLAAAVVFVMAAFAGVIGFLVAYAFSLSAVVFAVSGLLLGRPTGVREVYMRVRSKFWRIAGVTFSTGIRVVGGLLLFIIPGIFLMLKCALAIPVALLEDAQPSQAIMRSVFLTKGSWGRTCLIFFLIWLLNYASVSLFQFPFTAAQALFERNGVQVLLLGLLSQLAAYAAGTLVAPFGTIALCFLYYDERVRKEDADLPLILETLE